jgi:catalase-peroxidase
VTSGFEGPWTKTPAKWSNGYFRNLVEGNWTVALGPGGHNQWKVAALGPLGGLMMLTSDISLTRDAKYSAIVQQFAQPTSKDSNNDFDWAFQNAWYKLTTRDMGPYARCVQAPGTVLPPPQTFQFPLPAAAAQLPDWTAVRAALRKVMRSSSPLLPPDQAADGSPYYGAVFVELAWQCATTFRRTDYLGGCNGARIQVADESPSMFMLHGFSILFLLLMFLMCN